MVKEVTNIKSKAQQWSVDISLGIIVFLTAFLIFYTMLNINQNTKVRDLKAEASNVVTQLGSEESSLSIVKDNQISTEKLNELKDIKYDELKRMLRTEGDFCIYLEDEKGNLILISKTKGKGSFGGIGAPNVYLSGVPCSQK